jgi:hypothetical protein
MMKARDTFLFPPLEKGRVVGTQVAFTRLGQHRLPNSGKPEFGADRVGIAYAMTPTRLAAAPLADLPLSGGGKENG